MIEHNLILHDEYQSAVFAQKLAQILRPGNVVALFGDLGSGKTTIAREIVQQLVGLDKNGNKETVISPTFNLVQTYSAVPQNENLLKNQTTSDNSDENDYLNSIIKSINSRNENSWPNYTTSYYSCEIFHFDLYRLNHPEEVFELGIEDALNQNICIIEWPEIVENLLPKDTIKIYLSIIPGSVSGRNCKIILT